MLNCHWSYHTSEQIWSTVLSERNLKLVSVLTLLEGIIHLVWIAAKCSGFQCRNGTWRLQESEVPSLKNPSHVWGHGIQLPSSDCAHLVRYIHKHQRPTSLHKAPPGHTAATGLPFPLPPPLPHQGGYMPFVTHCPSQGCFSGTHWHDFLCIRILKGVQCCPSDLKHHAHIIQGDRHSTVI